MAFSTVSKIALRGISACVPERCEENRLSPLLNEEEREELISSVGVERRRVAPENLCSSDLCLTAAEKLLSALAWKKSEIRWLVFVSQTPDYVLPATSCLLQDRLGLSKNCATLDISLGCSGWVYGLNVLASLLTGTRGKGLLLAGDLTTRTQYFRDKTTFPLFGDAGTATALEFFENAAPMHFELGTDGNGFESIIIPDGGFRNPCAPDSFREFTTETGATLTRRHVALNGMDVFAFAQSCAPKSIRCLCENCGIPLDAIDLFVLHQANRMINERVRQKLGMPESKTPSSLKDFGNTSSASIPLTLVTQCREKISENASQKILACGFGVGLSWGSVLFDSGKDVVVPELVEL